MFYGIVKYIFFIKSSFPYTNISYHSNIKGCHNKDNKNDL